VLAAAEAVGARLVVLDNLYAYGPVGGRDLTESLPARPASAKAATRAAMTAGLLAAHQAGRVEVAVGRASDFFGPGITSSALGETVFGAAVNGRTAQVMGRPDTEHSYSYAPDVAAGLVTLGTAAGATGRVWHLPVDRARTTRAIAGQVYALAGHRARVLAANRTTLRLLGVVKPAMREYLHTLYQFSERWVVDDTAFRTAFGTHATPLDDALAATTAWYRDAACSASAA
jgi:nucleoside-diphosphate-sugar epimerase